MKVELYIGLYEGDAQVWVTEYVEIPRTDLPERQLIDALLAQNEGYGDEEIAFVGVYHVADRDDDAELIMAAANRYNGTIWSGPNHGRIGLDGPLFDVPGKGQKNLNFVGEQGFVTNAGRFVDRKEAASIAMAAGQIEKPKFLPDGELDSADMIGALGFVGDQRSWKEGTYANSETEGVPRDD